MDMEYLTEKERKRKELREALSEQIAQKQVKKEQEKQRFMNEDQIMLRDFNKY